jgi:hypothetical protein
VAPSRSWTISCAELVLFRHILCMFHGIRLVIDEDFARALSSLLRPPAAHVGRDEEVVSVLNCSSFKPGRTRVVAVLNDQNRRAAQRRGRPERACGPHRHRAIDVPLEGTLLCRSTTLWTGSCEKSADSVRLLRSWD